jgi:hypothetical protein
MYPCSPLLISVSRAESVTIRAQFQV